MDDKALLEAIRGIVKEEISPINARLDSIDTRFDKMDARLNNMDTRIENIDARLDKIEENIAHIHYNQEKYADLLLRAVNTIVSVDSILPNGIMSK